MGWFEEQLKERRINEDATLEEAFCRISDSVTGANLSKLLQSNRERTSGAIGDVIKFLGGKIIQSDKEFPNINDELEFYCRPNAIMRRNVTLSGKWYKDALGAYLAIDTRDDSAVALLPDNLTGKYKFFDTQQGKYVKVTAKNASIFSSDAICFYKPLPQRKLTPMDLVRYGFSTWSIGDLLLPILLLLVLTGIGLIGPVLNHFIFNDVYYSKNVSFLISTAIFLAALSVSRILIETVRSILRAKNDTKHSVSIESAIMMRVLTLPNKLFMEYSSGDMVQRIGYANSVCSIIYDVIFETGVSAVLSLVYIFQMVKYAKGLVIPALCVIFGTVLYIIIITPININLSRNVMITATEENAVAYSTITGVQKIKTANAEKRAFARWAKAYAAYSNAYFLSPRIVRFSSVITTAISFTGMLFMFSYAIRDGITIADYNAFNTAYGAVFGAFVSLAGIVDSLANIKPILEMIAPIMDTEPEISEGKTPVSKISGNIELNNIYFRYSDNMPMIFNNLSMKIKAGQYVAIVGKTGCGKSTLIRLLLGFEKPQKGAIYYDGKDISSIDLRSLRRCIGTVMQNGKLFEGDIYSNIVISAPWLTLDDAWEAAELAGMADDIAAMPMGMQTLISEGSGGISGGQRQRLLIARAIAPKPKVLIFDEATSALDNITQKKVSESLDSLNCTRIVIAHRLSTIRHCDRIIFLDGGKIVEDGTYEELIALNGQFAELVQRQRIDGEEQE